MLVCPCQENPGPFVHIEAYKKDTIATFMKKEHKAPYINSEILEQVFDSVANCICTLSELDFRPLRPLNHPRLAKTSGPTCKPWFRSANMTKQSISADRIFMDSRAFVYFSTGDIKHSFGRSCIKCQSNHQLDFQVDPPWRNWLARLTVIRYTRLMAHQEVESSSLSGGDNIFFAFVFA